MTLWYFVSAFVKPARGQTIPADAGMSDCDRSVISWSVFDLHCDPGNHAYRLGVIFIISFTFYSNLFSQNIRVDSTVLPQKNIGNLRSPDLRTLHPTGIFTSNINFHFQQQPSKDKVLRMQLGSGNVWLPAVTGFIPLDATDRNRLEKLPWHKRESEFDPHDSSSESIRFQADGVIKTFLVDLTVPLRENWELDFKVKTCLLTKGKTPFSLLTTDSFIEWFHTRVLADEDPFARKYYGFNKAGISFTDEDGHVLTWNSGEFFVPGIETSFYYFPELYVLKELGLSLNLGIHPGFNLSRFNRSFDLGASVNMVQETFSLNHVKLYFSGGYSLMRPGLISFEDPVNIYTVDLFHGVEGKISFQFPMKNERQFGLDLHYTYQSPYRRRHEFDYTVLTGERISSHWHFSVSHLYKPFHYGSIVFSLSGKNTISVYLRQDLVANNAPDIQSGIEWAVPIH